MDDKSSDDDTGEMKWACEELGGPGPKHYEGKKSHPGPPPGNLWGPEGHQTASGLEPPAAS